MQQLKHKDQKQVHINQDQPGLFGLHLMNNLEDARGQGKCEDPTPGVHIQPRTVHNDFLADPRHDSAGFLKAYLQITAPRRSPGLAIGRERLQALSCRLAAVEDAILAEYRRLGGGFRGRN